MEPITKLLLDYQGGNKAALDELTPLVYHELRKLADSCLRRERSDHTLQPTALIHEAYMRLIEQNLPSWQSRAHFFGVAARIMRQILVDFARRHRSAKRGSGQKVALDEAIALSQDSAQEFLDLNGALDKLSNFDERKCRVIELRYFAGLSREETAEALGLSLATVKRDLSLAEAWLRRELSAAPLS